MSEATDKLARSRLAIVEHIHRRERRHDPREMPPPQYEAEDMDMARDMEPPGQGWLGHLRYAVATWWRYHPAHMAADLVSPLMHEYARRKPVQLLGISLAAGAALTFARPWRLISLTTLVVA